MRQITGILAKNGAAFLMFATVSWAGPVEIVGSLYASSGQGIGGTVTIIGRGPQMVLEHHRVGETGKFRIRSGIRGEFIVLARAPDHAPDELVVPARVSGVLPVRFVLPAGQPVEGRVVDSDGNGVPGAALRVRYHEPGKPHRSVAFSEEEVTDGDGRFKFRNVGAEVPFVVDAYSPNHVAETSQQFKVAPGSSRPLKDIVLREPGSTVLVKVLDKSGSPLSGADVFLVADPDGLPSKADGSWLHHRSFRKRDTTSSLGNTRFTGVPPGRVIVRAKTDSTSIEDRTVVFSGQESTVVLQAL